MGAWSSSNQRNERCTFVPKEMKGRGLDAALALLVPLEFRESPECELRLIGFLGSSRRHSPTPLYLSFTKGLRPFNSEAQGRV
jgi:hypothetical protein